MNSPAPRARWEGTVKQSTSLTRASRCLRCFLLRTIVFSVAASLFLAATASAQKSKTKKGKDAQVESVVLPPLPDDRAIDLAISEMLGAWQIGDVERLHKHFSDNVVVVSGAWEPPVVGWSNYLRAYLAQRQRVQSVRKDRFNTLIKVEGNVGWASYQWRFDATMNNSPLVAFGQTTLILEKRDQWVIVHDHTSLIQQLSGKDAVTSPPPAAQKPPEKP